ncbi:TetR/AcrR family transcriptional regulator [Cryptosporangium sp. NPDC051539]|uniref:TetR/AcrR family transcriptional regulator n=1 Tax=Cryptosporangium sp. NPDC051539 TaxID=3363962 RepID=UPI0037AAB0A2
MLAAADELLRREGMAGFTMEGVAALSGASKVTIYKWWATKGVLALEAYAASVDPVLGMPDTGDIEADIVVHLKTFVGLLRNTTAGKVTAELLGAAQTDPEMAAAFRRIYLEPRRSIGIRALRDAQERRQIRIDVDLEVVSDQLWGACMYRLLTGSGPLDDDFVGMLVGNVMVGIRPGNGRAPSPSPAR